MTATANCSCSEALGVRLNVTPGSLTDPSAVPHPDFTGAVAGKITNRRSDRRSSRYRPPL